VQVEKLKAWQAAQEREAAVRPEAKRWIDPAIVERCAGVGAPQTALGEPLVLGAVTLAAAGGHTCCSTCVMRHVCRWHDAAPSLGCMHCNSPLP
jgi:hypothetical protein